MLTSRSELPSADYVGFGGRKKGTWAYSFGLEVMKSARPEEWLGHVTWIFGFEFSRKNIGVWVFILKCPRHSPDILKSNRDTDFVFVGLFIKHV